MLQHAHVRSCVERRASGQHQPVAAGHADQTVNDVDETILENHLGGRRLVEPFLRIRPVMDVFDTQDRIGVPHLLRRDGRPQDLGEILGIGLTKHAPGPIRKRPVEIHVAVRPKIEDVSQLPIESVGRTVHVAIGRGAHVAAFAAERCPAALRRADDAVKHSERVEHAGVAPDLQNDAVLAEIERGRGEVARTIDNYDHRLLPLSGERRGQI
jgi:hypothetical protein